MGNMTAHVLSLASCVNPPPPDLESVQHKLLGIDRRRRASDFTSTKHGLRSNAQSQAKVKRLHVSKASKGTETRTDSRFLLLQFRAVQSSEVGEVSQRIRNNVREQRAFERPSRLELK